MLAALLASSISVHAQTAPSPATAAPSSEADIKQRIAESRRALIGPLGDSTEGVSPGVLFQIVMAEIALQREQYGVAWQTYMSLSRRTQDARLTRRAVEIAYADRSIDRAIESAQLWSQQAPEDREAENTLLSLRVESGRLAEATPVIEARVAQASDPVPVLLDLPRLLMRSPERAAALSLYARLVEPQLKVVHVRLAYARLAAWAGDSTTALAQARAALALDPASELAALTTAQLLAKAEPKEVTDLLEGFIARNPKSVEVRIALGRARAVQKDYDGAREALQGALALEPRNLDALLALGLISVQKRQYTQAETELREYIEAAGQDDARADDRDIDTALFSLADIAEDSQRLELANEWLSQVDDGTRYLFARTRMASNLVKLGRVDEALATVRGLTGRNADEQRVLAQAEAQVLRDAGRHQEAFDTLAAALSQQPDAADLLYDQALTAEKLERFEFMETQLRRVIALRPADAHAYNALGYSLVDRGVRLDEAATLLSKAIELSPNDAYIIDSMGWLEFRRGNFDKASQWLERAYELRRDAEIAAHLGEVYWAAGRRGDALKLWQEAQRRDPHNDTLAETLKRYEAKP